MRKFKLIDKSLLSIENEKGRLSVFGLAFPLFFEAIAVHLVGMLQSMLSARYEGGFFVTPFSIANQVLGMMSTIVALVAVGMGIILSINIGRQKVDDCKRIIGTAGISALVFSIFIAIIALIFTTPFLKLMGLNKSSYAAFMPHAKIYFRVRIIAIVISAITGVINTALSCNGYTKIGLISGLSTSTLSVVATYLAMYVIKMPFDSAALVLGLITVVLGVVSLLISTVYFLSKKLQLKICFDKYYFKSIIGVGLPASVSGIFYTLSTVVTSIICTSLSVEAYETKIYVSNILFFVNQLGYAIGRAHSIMAGRMCGMREFDKLDKMHRQNLRIAIFSNVMFTLLFLAISKPLMKLFYDASPDIMSYAVIIFAIDIAVEVGRAMNHVGQNGLNATGDVKMTTLISIISCWVCSVGFSALFVYVFKLDLYGIWIAFAIDELFRGTFYYLRWRKGRWRKSFEREELALKLAEEMAQKKLKQNQQEVAVADANSNEAECEQRPIEENNLQENPQ